MCRSTLLLLPVLLLVSIAEAAHYDVTVGKDSQLKFVPETLNPAVGDTVTYHFFAKNHSVVESSFDDPCHPVAGGFFSGFTPNPLPDVAAATTWTISINDTKPVWVYCSQINGDHCQKGMVHALNAPTSGNTIDAYKAKAATASTSTSPPDGLPVGGLRLLHIDVGLGGNLTFTPNNVTNELPRTMVEFSFNPANHSVVQSSFGDPCHPLDHGFTSGFVPTNVSPSGVLFDIVINDTKPIWFYCAQTKKSHCQSGMVGSINAPATGNTLLAFIDLAAKASESTILPEAPLGGVLSVNGTVIPSLNGNVLNVTGLDFDTISYVPPAGQNMSDYLSGMAGGGPPNSYNWAPTISDNATDLLQLLQWFDDIFLEIVVDGYSKLNGGSWSNSYPKSIVDIIGTLSAQALVHRSTSTDSLQHYSKDVMGLCTYNIPNMNVDAFLHAALTLLLLEIGLILDIIGKVASTDPWLIPALATQVGAKSRMTAVVNMMQNHMAAAAPREALMPAALAYSYAMNNYVADCPDKMEWLSAPIPPLQFTSVQKLGSTDRVASVTVAIDANLQKDGQLYLAWLGAWGTLQFSSVQSSGFAEVPSTLYGHVWGVLVKQSAVKLQDLPSVAVAGPELLWVSNP